jgi:hypothetical protein
VQPAEAWRTRDRLPAEREGECDVGIRNELDVRIARCRMKKSDVWKPGPKLIDVGWRDGPRINPMVDGNQDFQLTFPLVYFSTFPLLLT